MSLSISFGSTTLSSKQAGVSYSSSENVLVHTSYDYLIDSRIVQFSVHVGFTRFRDESGNTLNISPDQCHVTFSESGSGSDTATATFTYSGIVYTAPISFEAKVVPRGKSNLNAPSVVEITNSLNMIDKANKQIFEYNQGTTEVYAEFRFVCVEINTVSGLVTDTLEVICSQQITDRFSGFNRIDLKGLGYV